MRENLPFIRCNALGINRDNDALAPELFRAGANQIGIGERGGIDADFVRTRAQHREHIVHRLDATTDRERHEAFVGRTFDDIDHGGTAMRTGRNVEENHFVRALLIVTHGQFHGVADIAQLARLGLAELDAAGDMAAMDVQARDNTFCNHSQH